MLIQVQSQEFADAREIVAKLSTFVKVENGLDSQSASRILDRRILAQDNEPNLTLPLKDFGNPQCGIHETAEVWISLQLSQYCRRPSLDAKAVPQPSPSRILDFGHHSAPLSDEYSEAVNVLPHCLGRPGGHGLLEEAFARADAAGSLPGLVNGIESEDPPID